MRSIIGGFGAILAGAMATVPAHAQPANAAATQAATSADRRLAALYDGYSAWEAKEFEYFEDARGETKATAHLAHVDPGSQLRRAEHMRQLLGQLNAIPETQLSAEERVNAAVFRTILENNIAEARFREWEMPFNSDSSFWTYLDSREPFESADEYRRYISRMRDIPRFFDENIANMRDGLTRGFSVPRATLQGRDKSVSTFIVGDAATSAFYKPFEAMPSAIPAAEQAALRTDAIE